jgi:hypothetical protein
LLAHGRTIPSAKHITRARRLDVRECVFPALLRTRIAAGPASSITVSTASRISPDVAAILSPTLLTACEITLSALWSMASARALALTFFIGLRDFVLCSVELWNGFGFAGRGNTPPTFSSLLARPLSEAPTRFVTIGAHEELALNAIIAATLFTQTKTPPKNYLELSGNLQKSSA